MSLVTEYEIIFFTGVQTVRRRHIFRSWVVEKQHTEIFSVANFVLSKKRLVKKRFVPDMALLKKPFSTSYQENAIKIAME